MLPGRHLGHRALNNADKARMARANASAADLAPVIAELRAAGVTSLKAIAAALDARNVPTPAGSTHWQPAQVARLLKAAGGVTRRAGDFCPAPDIETIPDVRC
jgi:hypothetical protein